MTIASETKIDRVIENSHRKSSTKQAREIVSERITYKNYRGLRVVGYFDHPEGSSKDRPLVIIPPAYGETKKDYISLSYYLVANGFNVVRYDNTDNLGESDGEILNADLIEQIEDLSTTVGMARDRFQSPQIFLVAASVAGRIAIRFLSIDKRIEAAAILVGVVDLRKTLQAIYREDVIEAYQRGRRSGTVDIFGHEVKDDFIRNAIANGLEDYEGTKDDIRKIHIPIIFFAAERDAWIDISDVQGLRDLVVDGRASFRIISGGLHQLQENPRLAKSTICEVTLWCVRMAGLIHEGDLIKCKEPNLHDIVSQNRIELEQLKSQSIFSKEGEKDFWEKYLGKFSIIMRTKDYQDLLSDVERLLGELKDGDWILDAGCGNGHFGVWLLKRLLERSSWGKETKTLFLKYLGLDFVENALAEAQRSHNNIMQELLVNRGQRELNSWKFDHLLSDLDKRLPFCDGQFNKICCNLVLSYLQNPERSIRELYRVLCKDGRIVVSSLKPYCDLSIIYMNFADMTNSENELEEARALLSNAGKIREKESSGHYHFYTEDELVQLMSRAGLKKIKIVRSLGNQANVAVGEKD